MASEILERDPAAVDPDKLNAFMGKMVGDMGAAMSAALVISATGSGSTARSPTTARRPPSIWPTRRG